MAKFWEAGYVLCLNKERLEGPYIMETTPPYTLGRVVFFDSDLQMAAWVSSEKAMAYGQVEGFRIVVAYAGLLSGHKLLAHPLWEEELAVKLGAMARFFLTHTVEKKIDFYTKKYRL